MRQSDDGRLTLILDGESPEVPALWGVLRVADAAVARDALRKRERIPEARLDLIGMWQNAEPAPDAIPSLTAWARAHDISAIVWTALAPKSGGKRGRRPSLNEALTHLRTLKGETRRRAEDYVRRVPQQIDTPYRRAIEAAFGWTPVDSD